MHTVSVRLSDVDLKCYKRLLRLHGGSSFSESSRFRFMLHKLAAADRAVVEHEETEEVVDDRVARMIKDREMRKSRVPQPETDDERLDRLDRECQGISIG